MRTGAVSIALVRTLLISAALAMTGLMFPASAQIAQTAPAQTAQAGTEPLQIVTASGTHRFAVEVMRTDEERARGLMFRRFMPADRGMLFDFKREETVMMWMKNTFIPLDMVFISRNGLVVSVTENTEPMSERTISSGGQAYAVLEINAGIAARLGLKAGDRIEHVLFKR